MPPVSRKRRWQCSKNPKNIQEFAGQTSGCGVHLLVTWFGAKVRMESQSPPPADRHDDDARMFREFLSGDREAMCRFVQRWEASMYRIAFRIVKQSSDAEEVRQTVLLKMLQAPDLLPQAERIGAWIRRCVVNESISLVRKRRRQFQLDVYDTPAVTADEPNDGVERLQSLLADLEPRQRALLALRFDENLTVRQIAEVMETPRSTIYENLQSAIESLRKLFESTQQGNRL